MKKLLDDRQMPGSLFSVCCNTPIGLDEIDSSCEDATPEMMVGKGRDIKAFLSSVESPYNYVILDDVPDFPGTNEPPHSSKSSNRHHR